jgi:DNA ligase-1
MMPSDIFKPNLAGKVEDFNTVKFPVLASPKIDGVRAMRHQALMSRSMKPIPNKFIQRVLAGAGLYGLDGELVVGSPTDPNCMQNTTSGVMAIDKTPSFQYYVFDRIDQPHHIGFFDRYLLLQKQVVDIQSTWAGSVGAAEWTGVAAANRIDGGGTGFMVCPIVLVPHEQINDIEELLAYEAERLAEGWEGVMIRAMNGVYKQGRSTPKEGGLLKVKRFTDDEATIIGFVEEMKNNNPKVTNELGRSKRSSHAAGKTGKDTLGALHVRNRAGTEFHVGSGIDDGLAAEIWANQDKYLGKLITYKSFLIGVKDAPRHPVFKAFRSPLDISK